MSYSLDDFEGCDLGQYFSDTWVKYKLGTNTKAGYIAGFSGDRAVIKSDIDSDVVNVSDIIWSGLNKPQCIAYNDRLWFIGPSGTRSYKKPPTPRNTMALVYRENERPFLTGPGTGNGEVSSHVLQHYLMGGTSYPLDEGSVAILLDHGARAIALSEQSGMFYTSKGQWVFVHNCIIVERVDRNCDAVILAGSYLNHD